MSLKETKKGDCPCSKGNLPKVTGISSEGSKKSKISEEEDTLIIGKVSKGHKHSKKPKHEKRDIDSDGSDESEDLKGSKDHKGCEDCKKCGDRKSCKECKKSDSCSESCSDDESSSDEDCGKAYLKLRITQTITEDSNTYYDMATASGDGSYIWVVVTKTIGVAGQEAAKLYANNNGVLTLLSTVLIEDPYISVAGGAISDDGRLAYLVEENVDGSLGRLRVFAIPSMAVSIIPLTNINDANIFLTAS
jgi:hypothetical protein